MDFRGATGLDCLRIPIQAVRRVEGVGIGDGHLAGGFVEGHAAKAEGGVGATLRYATA
jgi:hypothetical protein